MSIEDLPKVSSSYSNDCQDPPQYPKRDLSQAQGAKSHIEAEEASSIGPEGYSVHQWSLKDYCISRGEADLHNSNIFQNFFAVKPLIFLLRYVRWIVQDLRDKFVVEEISLMEHFCRVYT